MNEAQPSLLELCDHARRSCTVNGLIPKEWRWGHDAICFWLNSKDYGGKFLVIKGQQITMFQGIPALPMDDLNQTGVACIGKKPYVSLLKKE